VRPALKKLIFAIAGQSQPAFALAHPLALPTPRRLGVLTGSFNPLTRAHVALAQAGRRAGLDIVLLAITVQTIDKERVAGLALDERLELLIRYARRRRRLAVGAFNQGLYVDQARALAARWPETALSFLIGYDKLLQILDPRYYTDREAALAALFTRADLLVAPRDRFGPEEIETLLARPENAPYGKHIRPLRLPPGAADLRPLSATEVRDRVAAGTDIAHLVPWETRRFLTSHPAYRAETERNPTQPRREDD
jgi:nicotinamide-nucleotide adenylyltransferase